MIKKNGTETFELLPKQDAQSFVILILHIYSKLYRNLQVTQQSGLILSEKKNLKHLSEVRYSMSLQRDLKK